MENPSEDPSAKMIGSDGGTQRYRLLLEYDGSDFFGWQFQPDQRTVQGKIEQALAELYGQSVQVCGAGRTDAGVHALGQVAHFDAPKRFELEVIQKAVNYYLPADVRVLGAAAAPLDFHARFSARWRWYRYRVFTRERAIERYYGWWTRFDFDTECLANAAATLLGEHDFSAFSCADTDTEDHRCQVHVSHWEQMEGEWHFHIIADRFLRHMVRCLVGTMMDAARGRFSVDYFREILESQRKNHAVFTAPGRGLCLMCVGYGPFPALDDMNRQAQVFPFSLGTLR